MAAPSKELSPPPSKLSSKFPALTGSQPTDGYHPGALEGEESVDSRGLPISGRLLGVKPPPVFVQGSCYSDLNGLWEPEAETASGRWWYLNSDTQMTLYWDATCDGAEENQDEWIFSDSVPSVTAESDLDGE